MMGVKYNFSREQLKVLLVGRGYSKITGLNVENGVINNESTLNVLNELSHAGIISSDSQSFEAVDSVKEIIDCIGNSQGYMLVHSNNMDLPDKCLFLSDKVLVCDSAVKDKVHITVGFEDYAQFVENLFDEGYFPVCSSELKVEQDKLEEYEKELFSDINPNAPLSDSSCIVLSVEELSANEEMFRYLRVVDYYFYTYIVYYDGQNIVRDTYNPENTKIYLEKMINI